MKKSRLFTVMILLFMALFYAKPSHSSETADIHIKDFNAVYDLPFWYFKFGDMGSGDSADWKIKTAFEGEGEGVVWYRTHLFIKKGVRAKTVGLLTPLCDRGVQFYFNDTIVHETHNVSKTGEFPRLPAKPTLVVLPAALWVPGKNVIAMRTAALDGLYGFQGDICLGPVQKLHEKQVKQTAWSGCFASILLFFSIYFLLYYLKRKREVYYLYFSGSSLMLGIWVFAINGFALVIVNSYLAMILFLYILANLFTVCLIKFFHHFLSIKERWPGKVMVYTFFLLALWVLIETIVTGGIVLYIKYLFPIFLLFQILSLVYLLVINIIAIRLGRVYAKRILVGLSLLVICFTASLLLYMGFHDFPQLFGEGYFLMSVVFASALANRFSDVHIELEKANTALQTVDRLKDEFLSNTSHELRTPLNGIIGLTESIIEGAKGPIDDDIKKDLSLVAVSGKRLSNLVNDILDYSKLKNKDLVIARKQVDLKSLTDVVIELCRPLKGSKDLEIKNTISPGIPLVIGDETRLLQILFNLVGNGIKFTEKGTIIVSAAVSEKSSNMLEVTVADSGIGIPGEKQERIFESFEQADGSISREYGGTGIGLSIVKQLVELHQGRITIESNEGEGARFIFTLPISKIQDREAIDAIKAIEAIEEKKISRSIQGGVLVQASINNIPALDLINESLENLPDTKGVLLAIDDDPVNLQVVCNYLINENYTVFAAMDGEKALDIIMNKKGDGFDLVLLDIMMPKISGFDVCRSLRKHFSLFELPVIFLTAQNNVSDLAAGFKAGANDYLSKPFNREELIHRVETLVALKHTVRDFRVAHHNLLQKRMNPHFLFNALNAISSYIERDAVKAREVLFLLAESCRYLMEESTKILIPFEQEWTFVENYLGMNSVMLGSRLNSEMDLQGNFSQVLIPPLTIQPLVENSIKHGINQKKGDGQIRVSAVNTNNSITIEVIDNGPGFDNHDIYSRSLGNIIDRLAFNYKDTVVKTHNTKEGGALVNISFSV
ncbi:MAG: response regulator [bacterium]|nr:response regulator [bacterium]